MSIMGQPGFVYILVNPSANEFLKIGKTERDPEARAKELSAATGVPTPFYVAFQSYFQDCTRAEAFVHERLAKHRVASNREFFRVPLRQAIDAILEAEKVLEKALPKNVELLDLGDGNVDDDLLLEYPWEAASDEADNYYFGYDDSLQDYEEALRLYKQAARLGCIYAFWRIGIMYRDGEGCVADARTALEYFKEGVRNGDDRCWAEMAGIFLEEKHFENMEKCWAKYFASRHFHENITYGDLYFSRGHYGKQYVEQMIDNERPLRHGAELLKMKDEIMSVYARLIELSLSRGDKATAAWIGGRQVYFERRIAQLTLEPE